MPREQTIPSQLTCSICGCTETRACPGGCSWESLSPPICSWCTDAGSRHSVLAIDPSIGCTGFAVVADNGAHGAVLDRSHWRPSKRREGGRFIQLAEAVLEQIHGWQVSDVVIEMPGREQRAGRGRFRTKRNPGDLMTYARAAGTCLGAAAAVLHAGSRPRVWLPSVDDWKGNSAKGTTALVVKAALGAQSDSHDETDALGLGLWWLQNVLPVIKGLRPAALLPAMQG